jgi:hypothetical protein
LRNTSNRFSVFDISIRLRRFFFQWFQKREFMQSLTRSQDSLISRPVAKHLLITQTYMIKRYSFSFTPTDEDMTTQWNERINNFCSKLDRFLEKVVERKESV